MDVVLASKELQRTRQLLQEVPDDDFVQARVVRARVLASHVVSGRVGRELVTLLNEHGQIAELAILHDEVDVCWGLETVVQGDDVRVSQGLEDLYLAVEVLLEFLVQALDLYRLDGDGSL